MNYVSQLLDEFFLSYTPSLSSSLRENRIERMRLLLERIGNPERSFKTIHVAGSKGKGTVSSILSFLLSKLGYKTGLFLSPHVYSVKERFTLASSFFSDEEYLNALGTLKEKIKDFTFDEKYGDRRPTTFELYTAYSYILFKETGCTWAVIETGLGGRLDATNTIDSTASVITQIEKEHTKILGDTLTLIAREKSGIMRGNKPTFIIEQDKEVMDVFREESKRLNSPLHIFTPPLTIDDDSYSLRTVEYMASTIKLESFSDDVFLLDALYSIFILTSMDLIKAPAHFDLSESSFHLPGRFEVRNIKKWTFIFDGAHTVHSIELLSKSIGKIKKEDKTLIFSTASDKPWKDMAPIIVPLFDRVIVTGIGGWKKSEPQEIYKDLKEMFPHKDIYLILGNVSALEKALSSTEESGLVTVTGSFYLLGEIDKALGGGVMAINWKELEKILSELPLKGSYIQDITEHDYHSFTLSLFEKENKAYYVYTEVATAHSRFSGTKIMRPKSKNMQRFTQFLKAHVRGKKITDVHQLPFDRAFILTLESPSEKIRMLFRLYSGPGANVMILDSDNRILELMFRRPQRGEIKDEKLTIIERENEGDKKYTIREYSGDSFNEAVDRAESSLDKGEKREKYIEDLKEKRNKAIALLKDRLEKTEEKIERTKDYESIRHYADLLSASLYLYKKGMTEITLDDWETGEKVKLALSEKLDGRANLEKLYNEYHKEKTQYTLALDDKERIEKEIEETEKKYDALLSENTPIEKLRKAYEEVDGNTTKKTVEGKSGLYIKSGDWDIIVGRSAKENDAILRTATRGNDLWMHTRDFAGGYVIIKAKKNMTVPLEVLLDGAYLAIFFSKARKNNKADLYYTQVKNLKRIKGAKTGLIIPLQEKNLTVDMDEKRVRRLLGNENEIS